MRVPLKLRLERRSHPEHDSGLTLIELLVVLVILGVLAGVALFAVGIFAGSSLLASCNTDFNTVKTALGTYNAQMGNFPAGVAGSISGFRTDGDPATDVTRPATQWARHHLSEEGSELLTGSETTASSGVDAEGPPGHPTENVNVTPSVGPWLKDVPQNGSHYYIWASNDGRGTVLVGVGSNTSVQPPSTTPVLRPDWDRLAGPERLRLSSCTRERREAEWSMQKAQALCGTQLGPVCRNASAL